MQTPRVPFVLVTLMLGSGLYAGACSAVIGVDGDYIRGYGGEGGAATTPTTTSHSGGNTTTSGSGAAGGSTTTTGSGGGGGSRPLGAACDDSEQCASERCRDGVCCDQWCSDDCEYCAFPDTLGECTAVPAGEDPGGDCDADRDEACDGDGSCKGLEGANCDRDSDCISDDCDQDNNRCRA